MSPAVVLKVTSQTELVGMQLGGADLNRITRFGDPVVGGHVAAATGTVVVEVLEVLSRCSRSSSSWWPFLPRNR